MFVDDAFIRMMLCSRENKGAVVKQVEADDGCTDRLVSCESL